MRWRTVAAVLVLGIGLASVAAGSGTGRPGCLGRDVVLVSVRTGAVDCAFPDFRTNAVIPDGHGGWFAGVGRAGVGQVRVPGIAHLDAHGRLDRFWAGTVPKDTTGEYGVTALALCGGTLYAVGDFGVEALNASTAKQLWVTPIKPAPMRSVAGGDLFGIAAVAADTHAVFITGSFAVIDGHRYRDGLAALDPRTGRPLPWRGPMATLPPPLHPQPAPEVTYSGDTLALKGSLLLVGDAGPFKFHGKIRTGIFGLDEHTGAIKQWNPNGYVGINGHLPADDGTTITFAIHGTTVYTYEVDGGGNSAPSEYRLSAMNLMTHRAVQWHPKLVSRGYDNYHQRILAASADYLVIG